MNLLWTISSCRLITFDVLVTDYVGLTQNELHWPFMVFKENASATVCLTDVFNSLEVCGTEE